LRPEGKSSPGANWVRRGFEHPGGRGVGWLGGFGRRRRKERRERVRATAGEQNQEKMLRARVIVTGRVQGVYYRAHARDKAVRLGVTGWIRNRPDGSVEAVLEGNEPAVRAMLEWCKEGSPRAVVTGTTVTWEPYTGEFDRFSVREG